MAAAINQLRTHALRSGSAIAVGYRANEVPLPDPGQPRGRVVVSPKCIPHRSINFATLPDVPRVPFVAPISPCRFDRDTALKGIAKRYARQVPPLSPDLKAPFRAFCAKWARENLTPIRGPMEFEEWLATESYPIARKEQLRKAHAKWGASNAIPSQSDLRKVKGFIKLESYPEYKHARHINARCDYAKVFFGPVCKAMEAEVYKYPAFIKHVPLPERPALLRKLKIAGAKYVATDHTAFEAHFTVELQEIVEFEVVKWLLAHRPDIVQCLTATESGENHISLASGIKVFIQGVRCSGDMWTSLFNGLGNLLSFSFACHLLGSTFQGYVEGDDGIFAVHGDIPTPELMQRLGFEVKMEQHDDPSTASFCGMILAGDQIIRDPSRFFQSFGWSDRFISAGARVKRSLALAKSLSALYETPNCPLVSAAARHVYDRTKGVVPRFIDGAYRQVPRDFHPPQTCITRETRDLFAQKYGVSVELQVQMESSIAAGDWRCLAALPFHADVGHYFARYVEEP